ncbi:MAG: UDP-N-acetylmuramate dehydrogenase [Bacillota bacterium]
MTVKKETYGEIALNIRGIKYNVPMKDHTSFKLGGPADIFIEPDNTEDLIIALKYMKSNGIPYYLMGNGSNLLVSDKGVRGAVIKLADKFSAISIYNEEINAGCGILLSTLSKAAARNCLTGLEFASGIPGTLGGAVAMNAGAYGGEMKDVIQWVELLDEDFNLTRLNATQIGFSYRHSIIQDKGYIVTTCSMKLKKGDPEVINSVMADLSQKRKTKQPLHLPSAGSTFKRPEGHFAGKLIEDSGLKGFQIGGAQVSTLHCGFVVNTGEATSEDVYRLIKHIQTTIYEKYNIKLETEVKLLGEF